MPETYSTQLQLRVNKKELFVWPSAYGIDLVLKMLHQKCILRIQKPEKEFFFINASKKNDSHFF